MLLFTEDIFPSNYVLNKIYLEDWQDGNSVK